MGSSRQSQWAETAIEEALRRARARFLSTATTLGTAVDITVAELSIESSFPADAETAAAMRALV